MHRPELKDQPSDFSADELFFSITDPRGVITSWNDVFARISGYAAEELHGSPHKIVRHPHMPRAVFALLWEALQSGHPFSGYIKNLAKDGRYYWVYAVVVPVVDGFLSVRFKPTGPQLRDGVEALYRDTLAEEARISGEGRNAAETARAGAAYVRQRLASLGFASYEAFAQHAFSEEMRHRDAWLKNAGRDDPPARMHAGSHPHARDLEALYPIARRASVSLKTLFSRLDAFATLSGELRRKAGSVLHVTEDFHLNAMNANIAAQRLGGQAVSLGTVATFLGHYGQILAREISALDAQIIATTRATEAASASIATARLQMEMILFFMVELGRADAPQSAWTQLAQLTRLERAFAATLRNARESIRMLQIRVPEIRIHNDTLLKTVLTLEMTQVSGLTEAARWTEGADLRDMFASFRAEIAEVRTDLEKLGGATEELGRLVDATPRTLVAVAEETAPMKHQFAALAGVKGLAGSDN